jgi:hypothetical protein
LHRRLLIGALVVTVASFSAVALQLLFATFLNAIVVGLILAAATSGLAYVLWTRPGLSIRKLRAIELTLIALIVIYFLIFQASLPRWLLLQELSDSFKAYLPSLQTDAVILRWFALIMGYGIFIPNTLRRAAAVAGTLAVTPIVFSACGALLELDRRTYWDHVIGQWAFWMAIAAWLALYGSHKIGTLRRQAYEARQLGQYRLMHRLGFGGMGEVYLAEHVFLRRPCAVKLIRPERAGDPKNLSRFEREVQITAGLTHPNTIQIFDYGRSADGTFYCAMEYLPGPNLEEFVKLHGPLPPERAVYLLCQVCAALKEAHLAGLIHRDISRAMLLSANVAGDTTSLSSSTLVWSRVSAECARQTS